MVDFPTFSEYLENDKENPNNIDLNRENNHYKININANYYYANIYLDKPRRGASTWRFNLSTESLVARKEEVEKELDQWRNQWRKV